jgi:hypothetical protein
MSDLYKLKKAPPGSAKKWQIKVESPSGRTKTVQFGARGYQDYTQHKDKARRDNYRSRHRNDNIDDPTSAGFWSWHVLWGDSTDIKKNLTAVKRKYRLNPGEPSMPRRNGIDMNPKSAQELEEIRKSHRPEDHYDPEARSNPYDYDDDYGWGPEEYESMAHRDIEQVSLPPPYEGGYETEVVQSRAGFQGQVFDEDRLIATTATYPDYEDAHSAVEWYAYRLWMNREGAEQLEDEDEDIYNFDEDIRENPEWAKKFGKRTHSAGVKAREYAKQAAEYAKESMNDFREGYREARGNPEPRFPRSTVVQSLVFDRDVFTKTKAKSWARSHGFVFDYVDEKAHTLRMRQHDPEDFSRGTFRTIFMADGVQAVIGMPKRGRHL